jgi:peptidoglycan/LPS O-acetylase OafA/YrhL
MSFGGKVGVNVFFVISGYFMISRNMKWNKVYKLLVEVLFYNIIIYLCLTLFAGYHYGHLETLEVFVPFVFDISGSFVGSYLLVYILSPFINKGMNILSKRQWKSMLVILLGYFTILGSMPTNIALWNYFGWGITMYILGGYIAKFGLFNEKTINWGWAFVISLIILWGCEILLTLVPSKILSWRFVIIESNKITILFCAITLFMYFRNLKINYSKFINVVASSCFGVFLIHANCSQMRDFIWKQILPNTDMYSSSLFFMHMMGKVICIYIICTMLDYLRIHLIEKNLSKRISWLR